LTYESLTLRSSLLLLSFFRSLTERRSTVNSPDSIQIDRSLSSRLTSSLHNDLEYSALYILWYSNNFSIHRWIVSEIFLNFAKVGYRNNSINKKAIRQTFHQRKTFHSNRKIHKFTKNLIIFSWFIIYKIFLQIYLDYF
jgi:hypothetical protein